jgi:hypothetical protein
MHSTNIAQSIVTNNKKWIITKYNNSNSNRFEHNST